MERWLPISGYEGVYEVSSLGRVRSLTRLVVVVSKWGTHTRSKRGRILSPVVTPNGYLQVDLSLNGVHDRRSVHVLVAEAFIGPKPDGCFACHNNGISTENHATNLRYDTPAGNSGDMARHGTALQGARHPRSKLSDADVFSIRRLHKDGLPKKIIADRFGVSRRQISNIVRGANWTHLHSTA